MKNLVYSLGVIGLLFSCSGSADENKTTENKDSAALEPVIVEEPIIENSFLLESGVVGVFKIGETISPMPADLNNRKATVMVNEEGENVEHLQFIIFNSLEDILEIAMEKNDAKTEDELVIQDMRVISNYYETHDGIKVGALVSQLMEKYPDTEFFYSGGSGEVVAETSAYTGIQFIIDPAGCTKKVSGKKDISLTSSNFADDAKIKTIRVY